MHPPSRDLLRALRATVLSGSWVTRTCPGVIRLRSLQPKCGPSPRTPSRALSMTSCLSNASRDRNVVNRYAPTHKDRGPASKEDTQTDFGKMDVLGNTATPATAIDACTTDGFHLNNGVKTTGGHGVLLLAGEAFLWSPWKHQAGQADGRIGDLLSPRGVLNVPNAGFGLLELLYPKPDLLIIGTGSRLWMLGKETRAYLGGLGIGVDVMDTGNASAAYNLLATERGVETVGAAFLPVGWKGKI